MKKLFTLLVVMLMSLAANAQTTITWDYNTIKGIDFECERESYSHYYPIISKDGITFSVKSVNEGSFTFKDCVFTYTPIEYELGGMSRTTDFFSTVGRITSIVITCTDENDALYDDANMYGWTESPTSASWSGDPLYKVIMPVNQDCQMKGIQKITFTVDNAVSNQYRIYSIYVGWEINGEMVWNGFDYVEAGEKVVINPVWIPEGKKIKSMKVVGLTSDETTNLTAGGDGTWTLAAMPAYNVNMVVEYEDDVIPANTYTIYDIPDGWKVNGSTTSGTYKAEEGAEVIFTPANIPAGKKIKSIKVIKH